MADLESEISFFELLGFKNIYDSLQYSDKLDYAVVSRDHQAIHLQLHADNQMIARQDPLQVKIWVNDLNALEQEFTGGGLIIERRNETRWGTGEFGFYTPNRNAIIFVMDLY